MVDVLVSDIGMPGEDGYEFICQVRMLGERGGRVPDVALTAYARVDDRTRALLADALSHFRSASAASASFFARRLLSADEIGYSTGERRPIRCSSFAIASQPSMYCLATRLHRRWSRAVRAVAGTHCQSVDAVPGCVPKAVDVGMPYPLSSS